MKRRVFVTGGAHGIGRAIVEAFAEKGNIAAFCDIDGNRGAEVASSTGAVFYETDVADVSQLRGALNRFIESVGDVDVLVNNVGTGCFKPFTDLTVEEFDNVINTNLRSVFVTSQIMARHRQANGNIAYGRIINICSTRYKQSEAGTEAYSASKGGIYSLTHALAMSLAPFHITVNAIAPGWIHVNDEEKLRPVDHKFHPSQRVGLPSDIARMCLFLAEAANDFINAQTIVVDGGVTSKMIYPE